MSKKHPRGSRSAAARRRRQYVPDRPKMQLAARPDGTGPTTKLGRAGYALVGDVRIYVPSTQELRERELERAYAPIVYEQPHESGFTMRHTI